MLPMNILSWLNKPYPLINKSRDKLLIVILFGLFTFLFLRLYRPFGAEKIDEYTTVFLSGFGLMVSVGLGINYFLIPILLPRLFNQDTWQVYKEIIYISWSFLLISFFNFVYNSTVGSDIAPQHTFIEFFGITFSVGVFPTIIMVFMVELYLSKRNQEQALAITKSLDATTSLEKDIIQIESESKKEETLILDLDKFLFAMADNNYSTIYFIKDGVLRKHLLRIKLKSLQDQMSKYPSILRTHKSFLVNKLKIKSIEGNARSLNIILEDYNGKLPVSRSVSRELLVK